MYYKKLLHFKAFHISTAHTVRVNSIPVAAAKTKPGLLIFFPPGFLANSSCSIEQSSHTAADEANVSVDGIGTASAEQC
jgi:hypothetical protein